MAGGKLTARQKMINLMYLVFIAMLALNMGKEVLSAFGHVKEEITSNTDASIEKNNSQYDLLAQEAIDKKEKYEALNNQAVQIQEKSKVFYTYLESLKNTISIDVEDKEDYESMDKSQFLDDLFFNGDKKTEKGKEYIDKINNYRNEVIAILGEGKEGLKARIKKRFNTEDYKKGPIKKDWLTWKYKGFPLIASLTNMTQFQSNIVNTETEVLSRLLGGQRSSDSKITGKNYKGIVRLDKTAYFSGETVTGQVVLGRYDENLIPTSVTLGNKDITKDAKNGQIKLNTPAGNVGERTIKGSITFMQDGKPEIIKYETKYEVIARPNSPVISADKMNVVYRGVDNPISISLPGVDDSRIKPAAPGLTKKSKGQWIMRPGKGSEVKIMVKAVVGGKTINKGKTFRIKDIPAATGSVRKQYGRVRMPKNAIGRTPIEAALPDFEFDLQLKVNSFKVKVPGQVTVTVKGSTFNAQAKKVIAKARRGDMINIFAIKASIIGNSSYQLKRVLPIAIEVSN